MDFGLGVSTSYYSPSQNVEMPQAPVADGKDATESFPPATAHVASRRSVPVSMLYGDDDDEQEPDAGDKVDPVWRAETRVGNFVPPPREPLTRVSRKRKLDELKHKEPPKLKWKIETYEIQRPWAIWEKLLAKKLFNALPAEKKTMGRAKLAAIIDIPGRDDRKKYTLLMTKEASCRHWILSDEEKAFCKDWTPDERLRHIAKTSPREPLSTIAKAVAPLIPERTVEAIQNSLEEIVAEALPTAPEIPDEKEVNAKAYKKLTPVEAETIAQAAQRAGNAPASEVANQIALPGRVSASISNFVRKFRNNNNQIPQLKPFEWPLVKQEQEMATLGSPKQPPTDGEDYPLFDDPFGLAPMAQEQSWEPLPALPVLPQIDSNCNPILVALDASNKHQFGMTPMSQEQLSDLSPSPVVTEEQPMAIDSYSSGEHQFGADPVPPPQPSSGPTIYELMTELPLPPNAYHCAPPVTPQLVFPSVPAAMPSPFPQAPVPQYEGQLIYGGTGRRAKVGCVAPPTGMV